MIAIQEVIRLIDEEGGHTPFILTFCKSDGSLRDMVVMKRNIQRSGSGVAKEGSAFKYSLKQKNVILVNEPLGYPTTKKETPKGTHHQLSAEVLPGRIQLKRNHGMKPKSVKLFSIQSYNRIPVHHG